MENGENGPDPAGVLLKLRPTPFGPGPRANLLIAEGKI
jgi:hypothetical protein